MPYLRYNAHRGISSRLIELMPAFCFGSVCFKVFDADRDGVLCREEIHEMVVALLEVWRDNRTDSIPVSHLI